MGAHRRHGGLDGLGLGEEVAGHHRDVGLGQVGEEPRLLRVVPDEVQVRQVQHASGSRDRPPVGWPTGSGAAGTTACSISAPYEHAEHADDDEREQDPGEAREGV